tara:strand:- start:89 stop:340 length:252 start_codon:yes stop_codon:yes gene_type:complete
MNKIKNYTTIKTIEPVADEVVEKLMRKVHLVSSRQLAKILSKKSDDTLRKGRSQGYGFNFYTDKQGKVFYNLPEILKEIGLTL